jgi:hypothetical protein
VWVWPHRNRSRAVVLGEKAKLGYRLRAGRVAKLAGHKEISGRRYGEFLKAPRASLFQQGQRETKCLPLRFAGANETSDVDREGEAPVSPTAVPSA